MRTKRTGFLAALLCALLLAGCGVSQKEYDAVCAERDAACEERDALRAQLVAVQDIYQASQAPVRVNVTGYFTATVRDVIPSYVLDDTTPLVAVVTLFQDTPFTLYVGDLAGELEIGETYNFQMESSGSVEISQEAYAAGVPFADVAVPLYNLKISGVTPAGEGDYGLEPSHLVFELAD